MGALTVILATGERRPYTDNETSRSVSRSASTTERVAVPVCDLRHQLPRCVLKAGEGEVARDTGARPQRCYG